MIRDDAKPTDSTVGVNWSNPSTYFFWRRSQGTPLPASTTATNQPYSGLGGACKVPLMNPKPMAYGNWAAMPFPPNGVIYAEGNVRIRGIMPPACYEPTTYADFDQYTPSKGSPREVRLAGGVGRDDLHRGRSAHSGAGWGQAAPHQQVRQYRSDDDAAVGPAVGLPHRAAGAGLRLPEYDGAAAAAGGHAAVAVERTYGYRDGTAEGRDQHEREHSHDDDVLVQRRASRSTQRISQYAYMQFQGPQDEGYQQPRRCAGF